MIEFTSSLLIDILFYKFTNSPRAAPHLLSSLLIQSASRAFIRWKVESVAANEIISPNLFALLTGSHLHSLVHETGHALASRVVFKSPRPQITLFPFTEGRTKFQTQELTNFGSKLGKLRALAFVASGGPGASLLTSSIAMIVGNVVQNRFRELSLYLIAYGRSDLFAHAVYAFTAQLSSNSRMSHDFFLLSKVGLHPLAASIIFISVPLFLEFGGATLSSSVLLSIKNSP